MRYEVQQRDDRYHIVDETGFEFCDSVDDATSAQILADTANELARAGEVSRIVKAMLTSPWN